MMDDVEKLKIARAFLLIHKSLYAKLFLKSATPSDGVLLGVYGSMLNGKCGEVILDHDSAEGTTYIIPISALRHKQEQTTLFFWRERSKPITA